MDGDTYGRMIYLGLILASLIGWAMVEFRQRMGVGLRMALAWGMIFVALMGGYGIWQDMKPGMSAMVAGEGGKVELSRMADGHYYVTLQVNGTGVYFMVDTGASGMVLTLEDAEKVGLDPGSLVFLGEAQTANGVVRTAMATLEEVALGFYLDRDFRAYVNGGELDVSLLGMDYLDKFRIELAGDRMVLER